MIHSEPKLMVSDSIKDQFEDSTGENSGESLIAVLTFLEENPEFFITTIMRGVSVDEGKIKFQFSSNSIDGVAVLLDCCEEQRSRFVTACIDYMGFIRKIDLTGKKVIAADLIKIDFEKQTCECTLTFQ